MPIPEPRPSRWLAGAALIGGVPAIALLLLLLGGAVETAPGMLALGATILAALTVSRIWMGNLGSLAAALRQAADGESMVPELAGPLLLPAVAEVAEVARRVARALQARTEQVSSLRQADVAIIERLPDPLVVLDAGGAPLRANSEARAMFGASPGIASGSDLGALLRHPALADAVAAALAGGEPQHADIVLPVPVPRELRVHAVPMDPPLSDGGRLLLVLSDRTRDRAVERMRADFVANASHELRTPLASLIGFIETLRGPAEDDREARARFLGIMAEQADRMRRLIDDLLGLSRIEITEHQPPTGRVDLGALAAAEVEAMGPVLGARGARVALEAEPGLVAAPADAGQLAQVLRNLLENAARYGREDGTIQLAVGRAEPGGNARWPARPGLVISVTDEGPGIARHHLSRLTERFYRVDRGRGRHAGGTGLGLAIVKHIVNRHRGQLLIESEEGVGSTFRVWLPAETPGGD
ncbi:ATP-binding protein [Falsiroseomonas selenitidurans]|uniref:ATP-binding protein n=1 Tax=Falsiroseomonas selenitidurans TaxID=2716335 RepID=UPI002E2C816D|nr:ATP-binding protein [Falsiroseomonas selenitidurans]